MSVKKGYQVEIVVVGDKSHEFSPEILCVSFEEHREEEFSSVLDKIEENPDVYFSSDVIKSAFSEAGFEVEDLNPFYIEA